jgi:hypothetical protein
MDPCHGGGFSMKKPKWAAFWVILGFICLCNYRFSTVNQIPSDGPLTIGFPMTFHWTVCPMSAAGAGGCRSGTNFPGLIIDAIVCVVCALAAAALTTHIAAKRYVRTRRFWVVTTVVFALAFLLASLITAFQSASHHGHALEMGFPAVYLYEYAGDSLNIPNLAIDLLLFYAGALVCVAAFSNDRSPA